MTSARRPRRDTDPLALVGPELREAFDELDVPVYLLGADGTLRWANGASQSLPLAAADLRANDAAIVDASGRRVELRIHAAPLRSGQEIVGTLGLAIPCGQGRLDTATGAVTLTQRQAEVLRLLAQGRSTESIARELGIAFETARNHIRALFGRLDVHSRLEAVVEGRRRGLLDDQNDS
jgi:DNA-binding CsgD family transcriptional regulator